MNPSALTRVNAAISSSRAGLSVLHVASGDLWAGAEVLLYHLAVAQKRLPGLQVHVAILNDGEMVKRLRAAGLSTFLFDEKKLGSVSIFLKLIQLIRTLKPDVVHTHRQKENIVAGLASLMAGCPSLRTVHGSIETTIKWWQWRKVTYRLLDRSIGRLVQARIVAVSTELATTLLQSFPTSMISVIENGVDADEVRESGHSECLPVSGHSGSFRIGLVARLVPVKRPDIFVRTAAYLNERLPGRYSFWIFGDGPLRPELAGMITRLRLEDCVHLAGFVKNAPACLGTMDALLITSEHEGLPMNLLEAMALGIPVIARAVGAIPEVLNNGACGMLVRSADPKDFAAAIEAYAGNHALQIEKSTAARKRIADRYSIESTATRYAELYRAITR